MQRNCQTGHDRQSVEIRRTSPFTDGGCDCFTDGGFSVCVTRDDLLGLSVTSRRPHAAQRAEVCRTDVRKRSLLVGEQETFGWGVTTHLGLPLLCRD